MTNPDRTSEQAATLLRDLWLIAKNVHTLPFIIGTPRWWLYARYSLPRPLSEMTLRLYPGEVFRIIIQFLISLPIALAIVTSILVALPLHYFSDYIGLSFLAIPLRITLAIIPRILGARILSVNSPCDTPPADEDGLRSARSVLYSGRTYVSRPAEGAPEEVWFYINGVVEQGGMVSGTAELLQKMTGRMVNTFVNPSNGLPLDLLECMVGRTLDICSAPVADILQKVKSQLLRGRNVVIIGYSQGGIILSNVVKHLVEQLDDQALARVEAYSFASAADEFASANGVPFAEHFAAELDFVARFGALTFSGALDDGARKEGNTRAPWNGVMHMLPATSIGQGHLLKEMLLPAFVEGLYGRSSSFWRKYCDRDSTQYQPIVEHLVEDS